MNESFGLPVSYPMNLFPGDKRRESLAEACFSASSDNDASKKYKKLANEKMGLQDKLRKLNDSGQGDTSKAKSLSKKIESIDAQLNGG